MVNFRDVDPGFSRSICRQRVYPSTCLLVMAHFPSRWALKQGPVTLGGGGAWSPCSGLKPSLKHHNTKTYKFHYLSLNNSSLPQLSSRLWRTTWLGGVDLMLTTPYYSYEKTKPFSTVCVGVKYGKNFPFHLVGRPVPREWKSKFAPVPEPKVEDRYQVLGRATKRGSIQSRNIGRTTDTSAEGAPNCAKDFPLPGGDAACCVRSRVIKLSCLTGLLCPRLPRSSPGWSAMEVLRRHHWNLITGMATGVLHHAQARFFHLDKVRANYPEPDSGSMAGYLLAPTCLPNYDHSTKAMPIARPRHQHARRSSALCSSRDATLGARRLPRGAPWLATFNGMWERERLWPASSPQAPHQADEHCSHRPDPRVRRW